MIERNCISCMNNFDVQKNASFFLSLFFKLCGMFLADSPMIMIVFLNHADEGEYLKIGFEFAYSDFMSWFRRLLVWICPM